ncbi:Solute-binding family 1 [Phytophthora cactorum]|nr:Solute-binding family 1 [Phytophthora cactorum]
MLSFVPSRDPPADLRAVSTVFTRRRLLHCQASTATMKLFSPITAAFTLLAASTSAVEEETKTLNELYEDAIAEGGKLIFYHGGDLANQQDSLKAAFEGAFPGINLTMVVDYSKYHDVRIDNQLETDTLVPDITALQTVQNFPRWASAGDLLEYKPANFSKIYDGLKDENGAWFAYGVNSFSYIYDTSNLGGLDAPTSPTDLVDPHWAGKIASSYPHDDDAVLFVYNLYVEQYGWEWVAAMANQNISFNRGSHVASNLVAAQEKRLAILAKAKNPVSAKLFMNWILSTEVQESVVIETVRTDIAPSGSSHPWDIPEANLDAFPAFMANRTKVEALKQTFALYFGEVQGEPTPGYLGVHPALLTMKLFAPLAAAYCALVASTTLAVQEEAKTLDELYADAIAEGGNLVLYHGGDFSSQQDTLHDAFSKTFPEINFTLIVDYSKYHDVRIDNQLENDKLVPDIVALQTLQDFPRWAQEGKLLEYKPANFSQVYDGFRDQRGAYMAYMMFTFSFLYDETALDGLAAPKSPADLVDRTGPGRSPRPTRTTMMPCSSCTRKYGWNWVEDLANQNVTFRRGSNTASDLVTAKDKVIGVGTYAQGTPNVTFVTDGGNEYLAWGQRIAILSKAKHPAAAKLFMNWAISEGAEVRRGRERTCGSDAQQRLQSPVGDLQG